MIMLIVCMYVVAWARLIREFNSNQCWCARIEECVAVHVSVVVTVCAVLASSPSRAIASPCVYRVWGPLGGVHNAC